LASGAVEGRVDQDSAAARPRTKIPPRWRTLLLALASIVVAAAFVLLIAVVVAIIGWVVLGAANALPDPDRKWPRLSAWALVAIPAVAILLAFLINRGGEGRTFYAQQRANRRVSLLLLVAMVGLVVALGEAIAASFTFDSYGALVGAGIAVILGLGAAGFAHFSGPGAVLSSTRARRLERPGMGRDGVLLNVVDELSISANMPPPTVYVIQDDSLNALAVGTKPSNAALAVTSGMVARFDREQLQGVVGHELAHIRNLDSRYGVYVAILVGLVALVTDGFLRMVIRAWAEGAFFRGAAFGDDAKGAIAGLAAGVTFGIFLLLIAALLRIFAPIASLLVQAAVSRQREFLADATAVELTRNPAGLARALGALRDDHDPLDYANRGSQHLWFTNPVGVGKLNSARTSWFSTHPTLDNRIERLGELYPQLNELDENARSAGWEPRE
jgi:heat shock protein HtpX